MVTICAGSSAAVACNTLARSCFKAESDTPGLRRTSTRNARKCSGRANSDSAEAPSAPTIRDEKLFIREGKGRGQHSDNRAALAVQLNHFADHVG